MASEVELTGEYANLRMMADELRSDHDFIGDVQVGAPGNEDPGELQHSPLVELVIHLAEGGTTGAASAAAKAAVEAAIARARRRGTVRRVDRDPERESPEAGDVGTP